LPWLLRRIATLYPGAFALVMATGIISTTLFFEGHRGLSDALFFCNAAAYPYLLAATLIRVGRALWATSSIRGWCSLSSPSWRPRHVRAGEPPPVVSDRLPAAALDLAGQWCG
jgi:hypothetical protein